MNEREVVSHDPHDMVGPYALGALDDLERAQFERHLEQCARCRAELMEMREVTDALGAAVAEQPPAHIRDSVLGQIGSIRQERREPELHGQPRVTPSAPRARLRQGRSHRARQLLVAAALLVVALVGVNVLSSQPSPIDEVRIAALENDVTEVNRLLEQFEDQLRVHDAITDTGASARLVRSGDAAVVITEGLPGLPADQTYQAWLVGDGGARPAGLLGPGPDPAGGVEEDLDETVQAVAVSVEPAGGSEQPGDQIVLTIPTA